MDNKNTNNKNRDFSEKQEPKKGQSTIGEKLERLGDRFSRKSENMDNNRDSQR